MKQVKIFTYDDNNCHGGILLDDGSAVRGSDGKLFSYLRREGICPYEDRTEWKVIKVYRNWISLDQEIVGDDE